MIDLGESEKVTAVLIFFYYGKERFVFSSWHIWKEELLVLLVVCLLFFLLSPSRYFVLVHLWGGFVLKNWVLNVRFKDFWHTKVNLIQIWYDESESEIYITSYHLIIKQKKMINWRKKFVLERIKCWSFTTLCCHYLR